MNKQEFISALEKLHKHTNWDDGMGQCSVNDFVALPPEISNDDEIMDALWRAIENKNGASLEHAENDVDPDTLGEHESSRNRVWEMWTNGDIKFEYNDIQKLINQYGGQ
jgi:hypothetical protein